MDPRTDELMQELRKPKDISAMDTERQASLLVLSFIGYIARPTGISKELMKKCIDAFNNRRGKVEWEIEAVMEVLNKEKGGEKDENSVNRIDAGDSSLDGLPKEG